MRKDINQPVDQAASQMESNMRNHTYRSDKTDEQLAMKTEKKVVPNVEKIADRVENIMEKVSEKEDPWMDDSEEKFDPLTKKTSEPVEEAHKKVEEFVDVPADEAKGTAKKNKKEWEKPVQKPIH